MTPTDEQRETTERCEFCGVAGRDHDGLCHRCGDYYSTDTGADATKYCHSCAHAIAEEPATRDAQLRAELLAPFRELAEEWEHSAALTRADAPNHSDYVETQLHAAAEQRGSCALELRALLLPAPAEGSGK